MKARNWCSLWIWEIICWTVIHAVRHNLQEQSLKSICNKLDRNNIYFLFIHWFNVINFFFNFTLMKLSWKMYESIANQGSHLMYQSRSIYPKLSNGSLLLILQIRLRYISNMKIYLWKFIIRRAFFIAFCQWSTMLAICQLMTRFSI